MESNRKINDAEMAIRFIDSLYPIIVTSNQINGHVEDELDQLRKQFESYLQLHVFCKEIATKHLSSIYVYILTDILEGKIQNVSEDLRIIHYIIKKWDEEYEEEEEEEEEYEHSFSEIKTISTMTNSNN